VLFPERILSASWLPTGTDGIWWQFTFKSLSRMAQKCLKAQQFWTYQDAMGETHRSPCASSTNLALKPITWQSHHRPINGFTLDFGRFAICLQELRLGPK
jgi:hypothetical protein